MRFRNSLGLALGGIMAAILPTQAHAMWMEIRFYGVATGQTWPVCKPGDLPSTCAPIDVTQTVLSPYTFVDLKPGANFVQIGQYNNGAGGYFSGTVTWSGLELTGTDLKNIYQPCSGQNCAQTILSAPTMSVFAKSGVPEPATWSMMIAGFGVAGLAMRSRRRLQLSLARA